MCTIGTLFNVSSFLVLCFILVYKLCSTYVIHYFHTRYEMAVHLAQFSHMVTVSFSAPSPTAFSPSPSLSLSLSQFGVCACVSFILFHPIFDSIQVVQIRALLCVLHIADSLQMAHSLSWLCLLRFSFFCVFVCFTSRFWRQSQCEQRTTPKTRKERIAIYSHCRCYSQYIDAYCTCRTH